MGELLETMGTTPARSCLEERGKRTRVEKGREGGMMGESEWLRKGVGEEERELPGGITSVCILHEG